MPVLPSWGNCCSECSPFLLSACPPGRDRPIAQQPWGCQNRPVVIPLVSRSDVEREFEFAVFRSPKSLTLLSLDSTETLCQHRVSGRFPKTTHMFLQVLLVVNWSLAHIFTQPLERILVESKPLESPLCARVTYSLIASLSSLSTKRITAFSRPFSARTCSS